VHSVRFEREVLALEIPRHDIGAARPNGFRSRIEAIAATGVEILVDDFGKGWSPTHAHRTKRHDLFASTARARWTTDQWVKIERDLYEAGDADVASCDGLVGYAHEIGMIVYAKVVQTSAARPSACRDAGCDRAQGYLGDPQVGLVRNPSDFYMRLLLRRYRTSSVLVVSPSSSGAVSVCRSSDVGRIGL